MSTTLLLSGSVPPGTTGSAIIVGNLAKQFSPDEMVVAGYRPLNRPEVEWRSDWPAIRYIGGPWPDSARALRWRRRLQFGMAFARTLRIARDHKCTVVLAVHPPEEVLAVGLLVARRIGATFLPYFHNTYLDQRRGFERKLAGWLQPRVFRAADHVFVMSDGMVSLFSDRYPELKGRCSALVHTFSEEIPVYEACPEPGSAIRFTLSGNIHEICLDAARRMCNAVLSLPGSRLALLGSTQEAVLEAEGWLAVRVESTVVPRDTLLSKLREADILLLPHGFTGRYAPEEYNTVFPTRTIEYLLALRPILAHAPPDCFLSQFIRETGCALLVERADTGELLAAIERLRRESALRETLVRNALNAARRFRPDLVAGALRTIIHECTTSPPR